MSPECPHDEIVPCGDGYGRCTQCGCIPMHKDLTIQEIAEYLDLRMFRHQVKVEAREHGSDLWFAASGRRNEAEHVRDWIVKRLQESDLDTATNSGASASSEKLTIQEIQQEIAEMIQFKAGERETLRSLDDWIKQRLQESELDSGNPPDL